MKTTQTQFIAHRGNWRGKETANENLIEYLSSAYTAVGSVECDVQTLNGQLYLGHDLPQEPVELDLLLQPNWFCHAKDIQSLGTLLNAGVHTFWHQEDTVTLTSRGFIWCYPGVNFEHANSIWLDFDNTITSLDDVRGWGLCADEDPSYVDNIAVLGTD